MLLKIVGHSFMVGGVIGLGIVILTPADHFTTAMAVISMCVISWMGFDLFRLESRNPQSSAD
jgi:hypothetical protein